jgi:hypothetical protein
MVFLLKALIVTAREKPALAQRLQVYRAMQQFAFPGPCRARSAPEPSAAVGGRC